MIITPAQHIISHPFRPLLFLVSSDEFYRPTIIFRPPLLLIPFYFFVQYQSILVFASFVHFVVCPLPEANLPLVCSSCSPCRCHMHLSPIHNDLVEYTCAILRRRPITIVFFFLFQYFIMVRFMRILLAWKRIYEYTIYLTNIRANHSNEDNILRRKANCQQETS